MLGIRKILIYGLLFFSGLTTANQNNKELDLSYFFSPPAGAPTFVNDSGNSGTVASVRVIFHSNSTCTSLMNEITINSGTPVQFPASSKIWITPESLYTTATNSGILNVGNIGSAAINMLDANGIPYEESFGVTPCILVLCSQLSGRCDSGTLVHITSYTP